MKSKMFMATIMSIVLALGLLVQAVAAEENTHSPYMMSSSPGVNGGVPKMCTYSSLDRTSFYTITCAKEVSYSSYNVGVRQFYANDFRTINLNNILSGYIVDVTDLRRDIDLLEAVYNKYVQDKRILMKSLNNETKLTWSELKHVATRPDSIGKQAEEVIIGWIKVEGLLENANDTIDNILNYIKDRIEEE